MKRVISIVLVTTLLLALLPTTITADPGKKPITPPELGQLTFVHNAKPDKPPGKPDKPGDDETPVDNSHYELLDLTLPESGFEYYLNVAGAPAGVQGEIVASFEVWDDVTAQELFAFAGQTSISGAVLDGQNTVSWRGIAPRGTIAITNIWYDTATGIIVEADVVFNALLKWGIDQDGEGNDFKLKRMYDVRNIATHEAGHVVGLADLYEDQYREITMYGYGSKAETLKISLEKGDTTGAQYLYGTP